MDKLATLPVVISRTAPPLERLAAAELQRYIAALTGSLPEILERLPDRSSAILLGEAAREVASQAGLTFPAHAQAVCLKTLDADGRRLHLVVGGSPVATQWAAYRLLEEVGCGFYLGGDAIPAVDRERVLPALDVVEQPVFDVRGALPWYNFLNGPTTWNLADHRRFYDQLVKQRANLVSFHAYDWEPWAAYPVHENGRWMMTGGEPAATAAAVHRRDIWGVSPVPVDEYAFGTDGLFERGLFGADVSLDWVTHDEGIERAQAMLAEALRYARARGVRTCLGFEVTGDPDLPANQEALRARLAHITATYPLDFVCLWQAEHRGGGTTVLRDLGEAAPTALSEQFAYLGRPDRVTEGVRVARYFQLGHRLLEEVAPQTRLVVSGWGGDNWMRFTDFYVGLHRVLAPDVVFAALDDIDPTMAPHVSAVYEQVAPERECWPIPWFESDASGTRRDQWSPQPNVTPFAPLLADAHKKGCRGVLGIHWRTRAVEEVAGYTFRRAWDSQLEPAAWFADFADRAYGATAGSEMASVHQRLEELGPRWTGAAGQYECFRFDWFSPLRAELLDPPDESPRPFRNRLLPDPDRTAQLQRLRQRVEVLARGASGTAAERFAYLLSQMRWVAGYDRAGLQLYPDGPVRAVLQRGEASSSQGDATAAVSAGEEALGLLAASGFREALQDLAAHTSNRGELGVLAAVNGKAVVDYKGLLRRAEALAGRTSPELLGRGDWPAGCRVLILTTGDLAEADTTPAVQAIVLAGDVPLRVEACVQPIGREAPARVAEMRQWRGSVYRGTLPIDGEITSAVTCWVQAVEANGRTTRSGEWTMSVVPRSIFPGTGSALSGTCAQRAVDRTE